MSTQTTFNLQDKVVIITGGASGIGKATAALFVRNGAKVVIADLQAEVGELAAREVGGVFISCDITQVEQVNRLMTRRWSGSAAWTSWSTTPASFEEIDVAASHKQIDVNCKGVVNGLYAALPYLRATPASVAVNLASASAIYGQPELAIYSSTKFFIRGLTEALDLEWESYGIRVIDIWPLFVQTAMTDGMHIGTTDSLGIHLTAQDVADAVVAAVDATGVRKSLRQVHFPVGAMTRVAQAAFRLTPGPLNRLLSKRMSKL